MLEKLPKNPEQHITRSKNLLCDSDLLCNKYYMQYISNPIAKVKQQLKPFNATEHSLRRRALITVQFQPWALRSTHIAIPINIYEQQQVELASLQEIVKK